MYKYVSSFIKTHFYCKQGCIKIRKYTVPCKKGCKLTIIIFIPISSTFKIKRLLVLEVQFFLRVGSLSRSVFFSGLCFGSACKSSIHFSAIHTTERHNSKLKSTYKSTCNSFRATYFASLLLIISRQTWKGKLWCCSKKKTIPE